MARGTWASWTVNAAVSGSACLIIIYALSLRPLGLNVMTIDEPSVYRTRDGEFCVIQNALTADPGQMVDGRDDDQQATLVTHASLSYLGHVLKQSSLWDGPISVTLYVSSWRLLTNVHLTLLTLRTCSEDFRRKVSVHVLYPWTKVDGGCPASGQFSPSFLFDHRCDQPLELLLKRLVPPGDKPKQRYPVNAARNVARRGARTTAMVVADAELQPSANFSRLFAQFYRTRPPSVRGKEAFVVPVFELALGRPMPRTKLELLREIDEGNAVPFHAKRVAYECHRIPALADWCEAGLDTPDALTVFLTTRWLRPCWEPVYVSRTDVPWYDERFRGYGKNKIQQVYEMCRANYTFHILDNVFLVHYNISVLSPKEWRAISQAVYENNELFQLFRRELDEIYPDKKVRQYCDTNVGVVIPR